MSMLTVLYECAQKDLYVFQIKELCLLSADIKTKIDAKVKII